MPTRTSFNRVSFSLLLLTLIFVPVLASASGVHALFNVNSTTQSPFASNRFTVFDFGQNTNLRVNLPFPNCTTNPSDCLDTALLNQLDGFNTQPRLSIPFDGAINPNTVNSHTVFLVRIGNLFGPPDGPPRLIGINQVVWDPATLTLFAESDEHLDQHTSYVLVVTNGVHDAAGDPVEISDNFQDFHHDLNFGQTKDPQLKLYRQILKSSLENDFLEEVAHVSRKDVVAATVFTTGSISSTLERIRDQIKAAPAPASTFNLGIHGEHTVFPVASITGILFNRDHPTPPTPVTAPVPTPALQVFPGSVASVAFGKFTALNFETAGSFIPQVPTRTGV